MCVCNEPRNTLRLEARSFATHATSLARLTVGLLSACLIGKASAPKRPPRQAPVNRLRSQRRDAGRAAQLANVAFRGGGTARTPQTQDRTDARGSGTVDVRRRVPRRARVRPARHVWEHVEYMSVD